MNDGHKRAVALIREGAHLHYDHDDDDSLLRGDQRYAEGLVLLAASGDLEAVARLADAISRLAHLICAQEIAQGRGVLLVPKQRVRQDEARVRGPRVHRVAALASAARDVLAVVDYERESEPLLELPAERLVWKRDDALRRTLLLGPDDRASPARPPSWRALDPVPPRHHRASSHKVVPRRP